MTDTIKIEYWIDTGFVWARHCDSLEIDREDWESMSEAEKDLYIGDRYNELIDNNISGGYEIIDNC